MTRLRVPALVWALCLGPDIRALPQLLGVQGPISPSLCPVMYHHFGSQGPETVLSGHLHRSLGCLYVGPGPLCWLMEEAV